MSMESGSISTRYVARQDEEPGNPTDGFQWTDTSPPSGNAYTFSMWNADTGEWEIFRSVGPNNPEDSIHTAVVGSQWTDTSTSPATAKGYDGTDFRSFGVTDHAALENLSSGHDHDNLTNVKIGQHNIPQYDANILTTNVVDDSDTYTTNTDGVVIWDYTYPDSRIYIDWSMDVWDDSSDYNHYILRDEDGNEIASINGDDQNNSYKTFSGTALLTEVNGFIDVYAGGRANDYRITNIVIDINKEFGT